MRFPYFLYLIIIILVAGCAQITETVKVIWGSSTKALEEARVDSINKTYHCSLDDCFDAVLVLDRKNPTYKVMNEEIDKEIDEKIADNEDEIKKPVYGGFFDVFIKDRTKRHIVVMGISGNVNTTEVGIFFSQPDLTTVKLEVSSLSSNAKRKVAQAVFDELDLRFSVAN